MSSPPPESESQSPPPRDHDDLLDGETLDDQLLVDELDYGLPDGEDDGPNWMLALGVLVAVGAIALLVFDGMEAETYFFDVHEVVERTDELAGETVRVRGEVEAGTVVAEEAVLESSFDIATQGESLTIHYERALPDTFEEDSEIVAEGTFNAQEGALYADEVLVRCPSRYEGAPPTSDDDYGDYGDHDHGDYGDYEPPPEAHHPDSDDSRASR